MNIAIYDTCHYEMVNVLLRIFNTPENHVLFLISQPIHSKLKLASEKELTRHSFCVQGAEETTSAFFSRSTSELLNFNPDLFIFNTIDKNYKDVWDFQKNLSKPFLITIHNINTWLNPPFTLNRIALKNYFFRKKMVKRSSGLIVQEELFISHIRSNGLYNKTIIAIPHTLKESACEKTNNEKIIVAIPGAIDGVRRDTQLALDVIQDVHKVSDRFQFVFAGQVLGHLGAPIWERAKRLQKEGLDIQQFYDPTTNKVFDEQMKRCDIVFLPLNVETKFEGIPETYGTTKVTGVIYDMMRFCKPGIVPDKMIVPPTMTGSILSYSNKKELTELILSFAKDKIMLAELKQKAENNSSYYTENEIRNRVLPQIQKLLQDRAIKKY